MRRVTFFVHFINHTVFQVAHWEKSVLARLIQNLTAKTQPDIVTMVPASVHDSPLDPVVDDKHLFLFVLLMILKTAILCEQYSWF